MTFSYLANALQYFQQGDRWYAYNPQTDELWKYEGNGTPQEVERVAAPA